MSEPDKRETIALLAHTTRKRKSIQNQSSINEADKPTFPLDGKRHLSQFSHSNPSETPTIDRNAQQGYSRNPLNFLL